MILKLKTKLGTWRLIDCIRQIDYRHLENRKGIKIKYVALYDDKNIKIEEIETEDDVYILNSEGKTIEKV